MANLVIAAIPAEDDYIHKISSDKIPHLTLLFLGETTKVKNFSSIVGFVEHAASQSLTRFGLEVERRGELGVDQADVLFFSKTKWSGYEDVKNFRSYLLKDDNIRTAYDSTEQFPEWVPHITLGYPESPAKPDNRDYPGITYVQFDRIAVWFAEFEGIEIPLKAYEWDMAVSMSEAAKAILAHHGTKGMKWGVRRAEKKAARGEKKFAQRVTNPNKNVSLKVELHNATHKAMNEHIARINSKSEYVKAANNHTLLDHDHPTTKKYHKEVEDAYISELNKEAAKMQSPSGARTYTVHRSTGDFLGFVVSATDTKVKHADDETFRVTFVKDSEGRITDLVLDTMTHGSIVAETILTHHGVKGMKWGIRRKATVGPTEVIVSDRRKKIKTSGGKGFPAHADAVRARKVGQIGKKSGLKSVSDKDLQMYAKRLQLEQNVKRLNYNDKNPGQKFVSQLLGQTGNKAANELSDEAAKRGRKALVTAAAALV
jgi:2'-5' RNA ligase